jgi:signal transduction histidine kinase
MLMAGSNSLGGSKVADAHRERSWSGNALVRAIARMPWRVRSKLFLAFAAIVALFVVVGVLGLRTLGQSDARVESLGTLQLHAAAYSEIRTGAAQVRQLLALRAGGDVTTYIGRGAASAPTQASLTVLDRTIATTLLRLGPATDPAGLEFVAPEEDAPTLARIRKDYVQLSRAVDRIIAFDQAGAVAKGQQLQHAEAEPLANELGALAGRLASTTQAETTALIAENRSSFADSRRLFVAVGAASVVLALLLGSVLSLSVVGAIQRTEERLAEIASGDFSKHLDVPNRDELGALAANLNRMNDELGRVYEQLESQAAELAGWNRTLEARVDEQVEELRASRTRVVLAADEERRRIERNLHDGAQQHLIGLAVHLRLARELADSEPAKTMELLEGLDGEVQETLEQLRDLARGIYPPLLQDRGLPDALAAAVLRAPITARVQAHDLGRYSPDLESTVYFCCLEALQNAAKHAGEGATATVRVRANNGNLLFEVADDGSGFDAGNGRIGAGMTNMRDRVGAIGGSLHIESSPGSGTTVSGAIPLDG